VNKYCLFIILFSIHKSFSCTDFSLADKQGNIVVGRSMEFGTNLESAITFYPAGMPSTCYIPADEKTMNWTNKYGYLALTAFGGITISDGMNEKGLSLEVLWFPSAKYPSPENCDPQSTIALQHLGNYLLSTCASLEDVQQAFMDLTILAKPVEQLGGVPPIHLSFHDSLGRSLAVEFIDGTIFVIDNPIGVLTNYPQLSWHLTNLENYINLSAINKNAVSFDGSVFHPSGQGSGLLGIPGDWTPPSRFVKIALLKNFILPADSPEENVKLAFHLLNTVDIPYGAIRSIDGKNYDYTQWTIVKDLTNKKIYYRTYNQPMIFCMDLAKMLSRCQNNAQLTIPMQGAVIEKAPSIQLPNKE